ncbi:hypothetical protein GCM10027614_49480 [Micromonospora vulcania]
MNYRDWGRGEGSPRERQPTASWGDSASSLPVDPYDEDGRYRTSSRRRALDRGQDEPVDAYLPRWALESGVERADGGGRHAAPDDDDGDGDGDERARPGSGAGWRAAEVTSTRWRGGETSWRERPAIGAGPDSDHTGSGLSTVRRSRGTSVVGVPIRRRSSRSPGRFRTGVPAVRRRAGPR